MPDLLDAISNERDLLDEIADPSEPPLYAPPEQKYIVSPEKTKEFFGLFKKGTYAGLGVMFWPFERLDWTIATPLTAALEARKKTMAEQGIDKGFAVFAPRLIRSEDAQRESDEINATLGLVGRAWIPGKKPPEGLKDLQRCIW